MPPADPDAAMDNPAERSLQQPVVGCEGFGAVTVGYHGAEHDRHHRGVIMTMDISYAMLFLLWLVIVGFIVYGVWLLIEASRGR